MKVGLNLYSLRTLIETEEGFFSVMEKVKQMGYDFVQCARMNLPKESFKKISDKTGLDIVLTHVSESAIVDETDKTIKEHEYFGCKNIGLGAMSPAIITDEKVVKEKIDKLNLAGKVMKEKGFKFFYHAHHFDFYKHDGQTIFDYIVQNAPYINITLDTYWLQYGGVNVIEYVKKLKGRIECVHLKDYKIVKSDKGFAPVFTSVGDGNMNFKDIIAECEKSGTKYFIVEQDNAVDAEDPLKEVEKSVKYLKQHF